MGTNPNIKHTLCEARRPMIRTLNGNQFPGLDPFVGVGIACGNENERGHAAVAEGAGHGCSPEMGHGTLRDGGSGQEWDSACI